jgi:hypothetical protein
MKPHQSFADEYGTLEKQSADQLSPAAIFGITCAVLVFVCIVGFCCGRRFTLWCHNKRTAGRNPTSPDEAAPFSPTEQEML